MLNRATGTVSIICSLHHTSNTIADNHYYLQLLIASSGSVLHVGCPQIPAGEDEDAIAASDEVREEERGACEGGDGRGGDVWQGRPD